MALKKSHLYSSLWQSRDELRSGMDAAQYKDDVLTLLFMKYVSDKAATVDPRQAARGTTRCWAIPCWQSPYTERGQAGSPLVLRKTGRSKSVLWRPRPMPAVRKQSNRTIEPPFLPPFLLGQSVFPFERRLSPFVIPASLFVTPSSPSSFQFLFRHSGESRNPEDGGSHRGAMPDVAGE